MADEPKKVVPLRGGAFVAPGEVVPDVVDELERLLEMARSGELQGFAAVYFRSDDTTSMRRAGLQTRSMIGALEIIKIDMCELCR